MQDWQLVGFVMAITLFVLLLGGMWVAVALGITGIVGILIIDPYMLRSLEIILWNNINSFTLAAVPLFIFLSGVVLESGLSNKFYTALAGWLALNEILPFRGLIGCLLMFAGMFTALLWS